jgi:hypothetical protein
MKKETRAIELLGEILSIQLFNKQLKSNKIIDIHDLNQYEIESLKLIANNMSELIHPWMQYFISAIGIEKDDNIINEPLPFDWQLIFKTENIATYRAKVLGGWLVNLCSKENLGSATFIPDKNHEWEIDK